MAHIPIGDSFCNSRKKLKIRVNTLQRRDNAIKRRMNTVNQGSPHCKKVSTL